MSIRFVIGRAGHGKTRYCLDEIRNSLKQKPEGDPLIYLVPDQATFQAELELVSSDNLSGMIRAQVLSFHRLAWRVMQEEGGIARLPVDETGKKLLLHKLLHEQEKQLVYFQSTYEQLGFVDHLNRLFTEWKRYCVTPEELGEYIGRLDGQNSSLVLQQKLQDLHHLYGAFESRLSGEYLDGEDTLSLLAEQIPQSSFIRSATFWMDGFHGFTPQELRVVEALMKTSRGVTVTLILDRPYYAGERPDELDLFYPTGKTMSSLQELLDQANIGPAELIHLQPKKAPRYEHTIMLAYLEQHYDKRIGIGVCTYSSDEDKESPLQIRAAVNRRAEVEGTAREILHLVREQGARWRDVAVLVRNMEEYRELIATTFSDYGIPHFFDQKRSVFHHPLSEYLRSALEVISRNWRYEAVFRCVKTDFLLPWPLPVEPDSEGEKLLKEREAIREQRRLLDRLENYALAFGIQGRDWTETKPWDKLFKVSLEDEDSEVVKQRESRELEQLNRTRNQIAEPLLALQKRMARAKTVKQRCEALYRLLLDTHVPERLESWSMNCVLEGKPEKAREHAQLWDSVIQMLDQMVEMMGEEVLSLDLFAKLVDTGLESIQMGLVPPSLDQVLVGSMDRTRSTRIKYAVVLGVNEGVIPAAVPEDGVLTEPERELLLDSGVPMADGGRRKLLDEQFIIYSALSVPSEKLILSYALADEEGKSLLPSELVKQLRNLFPDVKEELVLTEPGVLMDSAEHLPFLAHPERVLSYLAVQLKQWMRGTAIASIWWEVYNWFARQPEWRRRLSVMADSLLFTNKEQKLPESTSRLLYGQKLRASVSRMERYAACPFSHFASYGLRLQERKIYRLEAPDIGQLFHAALSQFANQLRTEQVEWAGLTPEECGRRSSLVMDQLAPRLQGEILLSSKRYHYIASKLKQVVTKAAVVLGEHAKRGEFKPLGMEIDFGPGKDLPPLVFQLDNGCTMEIIGRIDRVDQAEGSEELLLRVIDYKSSAASLNLAEVYYGLSLQMLTYLDVIITHAKTWLGIPATPAGVLYFHVHNPILQQKNRITSQDAQKELMKRFKMRGLLMADPQIIGKMDHVLKEKNGHSELLPVAMKADGSFYKSSAVATENQWSTLREFVRGKVDQIGTGITEGAVDIAPYRMGTQHACQFCPYKSVCQFDPLFEGNEYHVLKPASKEKIWRIIEMEGEGNHGKPDGF